MYHMKRINFSQLFSKLNLKYKDPIEEQEYHILKLPLMRDFCKLFFVAMVIFIIPLIVRYIQNHNYPEVYYGIALLVCALIILLIKRKVVKIMDYIVLGYIVAVIIISIVILRGLLMREQLDLFYTGYLIALIHRLMDYRVMKFQHVLSFNVLFFILKFTLVGVPDSTIWIPVLCLEILPVILSFKTHQEDRILFDSLYKSKSRLVKFEKFLIEHLPNQMIIFPQDYSSFYFMNDSFKNTFGYCSKDTNQQIKSLLQTLRIGPEEIDKHQDLLRTLGFNNKKKETTLSLADFITLLSTKKSIFEQDFQDITLQVFEEEGGGGAKYYSNNRISPSKGCETPSRRSHKTSYLQVGIPDFERLDSQQACWNLPTEGDNNSSPRNFREAIASLNDHKSQPNLLQLHEDTEEISKKRIFKVRLFPLLWDNHEAVALILDDVTYESTILELKIADKNKDLIIAMVSHELRTPLNGMLGLLEIIQGMAKQEEIKSYLEACKNSSVLLLNLVNSILDFSQTKNQKLNLIYSQFSIAALLERIRPLFDHFCRMKNLYLRIEISPGVPTNIVNDQGRLSQVLINLLGNAFKFTFVGGVTINVDLEDEKDHSRVRFSVKDTGVGIKKTDQAKLFKMFGRIKQQDRRINTHGVGLGLTISNTLAQLLDYSQSRGIELFSDYGKGSTFYFTVQDLGSEVLQEIPDGINKEVTDKSEEIQQASFFEERNNERMTIEQKFSPYINFNGKTRKEQECNFVISPVSAATHLLSSSQERPFCLVVDDNPFNLMVAKNLLENKGYNVKTASNGQEAVVKAQEYEKKSIRLRFILMDCQMPVMDGYQATRILKAKMNKAEISTYPIFALTANNRDQTHEKLCEEAGMSGQISKPLQISELEKYLRKSRE